MHSTPFSTSNPRKDFSFSYSVPEGSFAHIRGYLHSSSKIAEASVQGWFLDARILPETTRWTPVWPGKNRRLNRDWRQACLFFL